MRVYTPPRPFGADWLIPGDEVAMWHEVSDTGKMLPVGARSILASSPAGGRWDWWPVTDVLLGDGAQVSMKPPPSAQLGELVYTLDLPHGYGVVVRVPVDVDPWDLNAAAIEESDPAPVVEHEDQDYAAEAIRAGKVLGIQQCHPPVRELVAERFPGTFAVTRDGRHPGGIRLHERGAR